MGSISILQFFTHALSSPIHTCPLAGFVEWIEKKPSLFVIENGFEPLIASGPSQGMARWEKLDA